MPGRASLAAGEYYAHPRNLFWRILAAVAGLPEPRDYDGKVAILHRQRIALWDVLRSCVRRTSLDSDIEEATIEVNDFRSFLGEHPTIRRICFNGSKAEQVYRRRVLPGLPAEPAIRYLRLPSTSPANAGSGWEEKLAAWVRGLELP